MHTRYSYEQNYCEFLLKIFFKQNNMPYYAPVLFLFIFLYATVIFKFMAGHIYPYIPEYYFMLTTSILLDLMIKCNHCIRIRLQVPVVCHLSCPVLLNQMQASFHYYSHTVTVVCCIICRGHSHSIRLKMEHHEGI